MSDTPDEAARINAEILEALTGERAEGAVTRGEPPILQDVIAQGEDAFEAPVAAKVYADAGVKAIYDIRTGERSLTSVNMLPAQLRKIGPDGKRMFTIAKPSKEPDRGHFRCLLHAEERKPEYEVWGLPVCAKANLTSPLQVEAHMQSRHPSAWKLIERERERAEKAEDRRMQRTIAELAIAGQRERDQQKREEPRNEQELTEIAGQRDRDNKERAQRHIAEMATAGKPKR